MRFEIPEQDISAYRRAADFLNLINVDVLCLQHEFGIFGGPSGRHLLPLLRNLRMPVVTTLHTILRDPSREQKRVLQEVIKLSARVVSMAEKGVEFLRDIYETPADKIDLIPHGIPDVPFADPNYYKDKFGAEGRPVLLTFGLLSPNKGIEHVLNALPAVVRDFPKVLYVVLGATHPNLVRDHGETYRLSLERLAKKNGVEKNVIFFNRFVDTDELLEFLGATDIYITPYLNKTQITSGTLAYSFGAGKAVISTPFWHAEELLADGRGVLVPFADAPAISQAVCDLLHNETMRHAIRKTAYLMGRKMVWSHVAHDYARSFERARHEHSAQTAKRIEAPTLDQEAALPVWKLDHLICLTDDTGMLQHAVYTLPNYEHGYCTDDNARALILMMLLEELEEGYPERTRLTSSYAAFLQNAFDAEYRTLPQFHVLSPGLDGRKRFGRQPRASIVGSWDLRWPFPGRRTTLLGGGGFRKGLAGGATFHVAAGMGVRHYRRARIPSHVGRRSHGQSASLRTGATSARALRSGCQPGLALVRGHLDLRQCATFPIL